MDLSSEEEYASEDEQVALAGGRSGGNSPRYDDIPTDTDEPEGHQTRRNRRRNITERRSPSPGRNLDSRQTSWTSVSEYKEGDLQGELNVLPPLMLGKWTSDHGKSYDDLYENHKNEPYPAVRLPEAFLIDNVLPPQCTNQLEEYDWRVGYKRMEKIFEAFECYRAFRQYLLKLSDASGDQDREAFRARLTDLQVKRHDKFMERFAGLRMEVLQQRNF